MSVASFAARWLRGCAFAVCLALMASPAAADKGGFHVSLQSVYLIDGTYPTVGIIKLPKSGTPKIYFDFSLPPDYKNGKPAQIIFNLQAGSSTYPCTVVLKPISLFRKRPGLNPFNDPNGIKGRAKITVPVIVEIVGKTFKIKKTGAFPGQRAGDSFIAGFSRNGAAPADTCTGTVDIRDIRIEYPRL